MQHLLRNILALLAAIFAGGFVIMLVQSINAKLYPAPPGLDYRNADQMREYAASLPAGAFGVVLASYLIGITVAVFLATRLAGAAHRRQGIFAASFFAVASIINLVSLPHPPWFWAGNVAVLVLAAWIGLKLGMPKVSA
jgi:hypothetical protein